jgi:signal transduction histidine kinase
MADKLKAAQQSLRSYIGAITAGVENERRSIARELHDDTIQSLIALNQRIQLNGRKTSPNDKNDLAELQDLVHQTMTNLRRMVRGLRPIYLEDLGLVASLEMLQKPARQHPFPSF